jgi:XTP/dITP diphosphohydrolase
MDSPLAMVIATRNRGKAAEMRDLLRAFPVSLRDLDQCGPIPPVEEDGATFDDNAYLKSSHTARVLGLPAMADDSGLVVEALGGAPGVRSARFAGAHASDQDNCRLLLERMQGIDDRRAAFVCVISIAVPGGPALTYEGRCEGLIARAPAGQGGFGYDPLFYYPPLGRTFAELSLEEKGRISHRGRALMEMRGEFERVLIWIRRHLPRVDPFPCALPPGRFDQGPGP